MAEWTPNTAAVTPADIRAVAPVLEAYTVNVIVKELWSRPGLSARDRSIVTVAALIARTQTIALPHYLNVALDSGVTPGELSEILTHIAFYAGWPSAFSAVPVFKALFEQRGIDAGQLPSVAPDLLPVTEALPDAESIATALESHIAPVSEGLRHFTQDLLYHEVWRRPGLAPRDRNLATVAALIALRETASLPFYLGRAMDKGITKAEVGEILAHLSFYSGWSATVAATGALQSFLAARPA